MFMLSEPAGLRQCSPGTTLYHYTKSKGINGILSNNCFWATKSDFLNDPDEFRSLHDLVASILETCVPNSKARTRFLHDVFAPDYSTGNDRKQDYFALSFSECRDSITMWSEFGVKTGYSLAMDGEEIVRRIQEKNRIEYHGYVIYDEEEKGVKWEDLPEDFVCELCGVGKDMFEAE